MNDLIQAPPPAELIERTEESLLAPARRAQLELPVIGTSEEPHGDVYWQDPTSQWWLFSHHLSDPTAEQYGGVVVPEEQREKLVRLLREGFSPDLVWVGHELPARWSPGETLPDLVPAAPASTALAIGGGSIKPELSAGSAQAAVTIGRSAFKVTKTLVVGAATVGLALGATMAELDPIIIAGVRHPDLGAVTWVEVTRWSW